MKYDDASWHYEGEFPENTPIEYGGTHIGLMLRWCFIKGWAGKLHLEEEPDEVEKVKSGEISGTEFLFRNCDGKLTDEDLNEEGNRFLEEYYGSDGAYLDDYQANIEPSYAPESAQDFDAFNLMVERRYRAFIVRI